jgi:hypothetical protein
VPSKDDLTEQLGLTAKLAAQIERMAAASNQVEASYSAQVQTLTQMVSVLNQLNVDGVVKGIGSLNNALSDMAKKAGDAGKATDNNFTKMGKKVLETGKTFADKFPKSVAIATGALSGFYQGIKNVVAVGKGIAGFVGGFVDGLANITASILAIPIKIFSGLIDMAAKSAGGSNELMQALEDLRKEFGAFYAPTNKAIIDTSKSMKGFSDTGLSTWRVFGNMADRLKYIGELAKDMGGAFSKLRAEFEDNGGAILAYQKGLGLAGEDMKAVTMRSVSMGKKTSDNLKDMTKYSYELGEAFSLDAKLISRDMGKALGDVAHFGGATIKQIAEASTYARKLGLELKDITGTLDAFDTFDTAAENVAKLSQSFGVQVDAFEMMKAQSPAEQMDMLRKSFAKAGVDASNFNRAQLKLVSSTTGLDEATVQSALSMKNQGLSMEQIQKKSAQAEKKTLTQAEAMGKLADAIERMVQSGGPMEGSFWAMFVKGIERGIMSTKEFYGLMRKIQIGLRQVFLEGVKLGRELVDIVPGLKDIGIALNKLFDPAHITELFKGFRTAIEQFFGKGDNVENPQKGSIPALITNLKKTFVHFFDLKGDGARKMLDGFKKFFFFMRDLAVQGIKVLSESLSSGIKDVVMMISGKKPIPGVDLAGQVASGGLGFLKEMITPIAKALGNAWEVLKGPLEELATTLWEKLKEFLWDHSDTVVKVIGSIFLVMFGPALTRSLLGAGVNMLSGTVLKMITLSLEKAAAEKALTTAASSLLEKGVQSGAAEAGPIISKGLWSQLVPFITTIPSGAAAAGAAALGAALSAVAVAAVAAYSTNVAADMQKEATADLTKMQLQIANVSGKNVPLVEKQRALVQIDATIKAKEDALKERKTGIMGYLDSFREAFEVTVNPNNTTVEDQMARQRRERDDLRTQVEKLNNEEAKKLEASESKKRLLDAMGPVTVENAADRFKKITDLANQVMGKDFNIGDKIKAIKDKLSSVDFSLFNNKEKEDQINQSLATLESIKALIVTVADINAALKSSLAGGSITSAQMTQATVSVSGLMDTADVIVKKLSAMADPGAANVNKLSMLKDAFTAINDVNAALKTTLTGAMSTAQRTQTSDAILGLINTINISLGNLGTLQVSMGPVAALQSIKAVFSDLADMGNAYKEMSDSVVKATANISTKGINPALVAVQKMVQVANDLNNALADGNLNKIDIKARLENVAQAVGLGGQASYTVNPSKQVQINLNLEVTMDVGKVEKVLILRQDSIIRDRIDFATGKSTHGQAVNNPLSGYSSANPPPVPSTPAATGG